MRERGFACKAELLAKHRALGARDRGGARSTSTATAAIGKSKMPIFKTMVAYLRMLARQRRAREERRSDRMSRPSVGIVGGGILGMTAAYRLAKAGVHVALFERASDLGGLVGSFDFDGRHVDRFYHVILPTDDRVLGLAEELGLGDRFRFRPTKVGFYDDGRLFSMTSPKEFLTFPLLRPCDRAAARAPSSRAAS